MDSPRNNIMLLAGRGDSSAIVYNCLAQKFGPFPVIVENGVPRSTMIKVRLRKLGLWAVVSQLTFMLVIRPLLRRRAQHAIDAHCQKFDLDRKPIPYAVITEVESVNSDQCRSAIAQCAPRVVIVNGTRIIGPKTLRSAKVQFINTHAGITPAYRGSHGGYWALYNGDSEQCGVTVHLVDEGIDTGNILAQSIVAPTEDDNFVSIPFLQLAAALPLLRDVVDGALKARLEGRPPTGPSNVWYHPGVFEYFGGRLRGVK